MRTRVETAAHARRAGETTFFRHHAMTARTGAGILAAASLDARSPPLRLARAPRAPLLMIPRGPRQLSSGAGDLVRLQLLVAAAAAVYGERERGRGRGRGRAACAGSLRQFYWPGRRRRPLPASAVWVCVRPCASSAFYPRAFCEVGRCASALPPASGRCWRAIPIPHRSRPAARRPVRSSWRHASGTLVG